MPLAEVNTVDTDAAARTLAAGGLVAFPTETVYGLGAPPKGALPITP